MTKKIHINDQGELLLIEAPQKPVYNDFSASSAADSSYEHKLEVYDQALTSAIEKGIRFRDQEAVRELVKTENGKYNSELIGQSFDLPNSYTSDVVDQAKTKKARFSGDDWFDAKGIDYTYSPDYETRKVAVLTPLKQEVIVQTPFCVTAVCAKCGGTGIIKGGPTDSRKDEKCSCQNYVTGEPGNEAKKDEDGTNVIKIMGELNEAIYKFQKNKQLSPAQMERIIEWLNEWEQIKGTVIPIRFKEDFSPH